jgi:hypothetical protein
MVQSTPGIGLRWRDTPRDSLVAVLCCTGAYALSRDVLSERSFFSALVSARLGGEGATHTYSLCKTHSHCLTTHHTGHGQVRQRQLKEMDRRAFPYRSSFDSRDI